MTAPRPDVAVVIVNHETAPELTNCLQSLAAGGMSGIAARVWVVDNASEDGSRERVAREFPWVNLLAMSSNLGYAAANNRALAAAGFAPGGDRDGSVTLRPRHALLLNADTIVPPGAIAGLVRVLDSEPDVGVCGPKLTLPDGSLDLACRRSFPTPEVAFYRFSGLARLFPRSRRFGRYNLTYLDPDEPADVDAVVGACLLARGEAVDKIGLLDERFWMYGEDLDWCLRMRSAGYRVVYRPHIEIFHVKRASSRRSPRAQREFERAMWLFYAKHYRATAPRLVDWLVTAGLILRGGLGFARELRAAAGRAA